jgi:hypothetical protein
VRLEGLRKLKKKKIIDLIRIGSEMNVIKSSCYLIREAVISQFGSMWDAQHVLCY